jgi:hypothetical protein
MDEMQDSRLYENPSAGRFEAPPPHVDPTAPRPVARRWWFQVLLIALPLSPLLLKLFRPYFRGSPWGWTLSLLLIPMLVAEHWLRRVKADEQGKDTPYTPTQTVTR